MHRPVAAGVEIVRMDDVAAALGHFGSVDQHVGNMDPVAGKGTPAACRLHHRQVVVVVPIEIVDAPATDIDLLAQMLADDGRILDVPGRPAGAQVGGPAKAFRPFHAVGMPEDEVAAVPALPGIGILAEAAFFAGQRRMSRPYNLPNPL